MLKRIACDYEIIVQQQRKDTEGGRGDGHKERTGTVTRMRVRMSDGAGEEIRVELGL